ncbi:DNA-directed RNA polymerase subunit beta' [Thermodesulfobacterium geofontis OPF15]|jgi:DNA-directed RNA polymerase subunit beta'|uniref:DNA-directed RNA polymerase subunit beta' n=1 Tax=Thermodesulfobacterium geofontis (strain OPF15) TaxID=795359 RepID=F8C2I5_THEGP|nr:DNA-directed RNA polymerase subunit beta' [Thermodesulfobacterium geofontis]AEH22278.1 DNA-directed RNA polymerase subunit beta' [Thermodesulfobacterium geofontis OPF15]
MKELLAILEKPKDLMKIRAIKIGIASPEKIREWSYGEVKKPETINYRTLKPEKDGLFCAKIFGPVRDFECLCGKYRGMKHRGVICEKCGVEVIQSKVRRERMGHIELAAPVAHIWYLRSIPSKIGLLLNMTLKEVESILYLEKYVVIESEIDEYPKGTILTEDKYYALSEMYGDKIVIDTGAKAIYELLKSLDLDKLIQEITIEMQTTQSEARRKKLGKRLQLVKAFKNSGNRPEWMILQVIPVIPPELRPLVPLEGGRFATSDLNDLYRRVINRNVRLKKLIDLDAPEIILKNEKRMLQEAVDALFDNGRRGRPVTGPNRRPLKSLSDVLKGKQGRFRQNLLGKRVDFSGRSVIVAGPELRMHQCGLPKKMALELFKPYIYGWLERQGYATNIKTAKRLVEEEHPAVWDALEEIVKEYPIMLNRAPTLHRLGIQAFEPVLIDTKAIQLHPLVCVAYNADFDGDQMAVHVPLSVEAQTENRVLILSTNNILLPANGIPIVYPTQDMVLGLFYMTLEKPFAKGEGKIFKDKDEVILAYQTGAVELQAKIKVRMNGKLVDTTVGRVIFSTIVPEEIEFEEYNKPLTKKELQRLINLSYHKAGMKKTVIFADKLKDMGFAQATSAALSICVDYLTIPKKKAEIIAEAEKKVAEIWQQYRDGLITESERYNKAVDIWANATERVTEEMIKEMETKEYIGPDGRKVIGPSFNPVYMMAFSGARGSKDQIRQLAGMRGLMAKPSGEIIETPIKSNFREGLSVLEYFVSTHGARKGLADTALKTANAGYLTRKLIDVAQDCMVTEEDCGTIDGIEIGHLIEAGEIIDPVWDRVLGRVALEDIVDPITGEVLVRANEEIDEEAVKKLREAGIEKVSIRSVLTCEAKFGVCRKCYGRDLATGRLVEIGEAVGIIAAQSIGEPGTQLTMRTFHIGGAVGKALEQSEHRAQSQGKVKFINLRLVRGKDGNLVALNRQGEIAIEGPDGRILEKYPVIYGAKIKVEEGQEVKPGDLLVEWDPYTSPIIAEIDGRVKFGDIIAGVTVDEKIDPTTGRVSIVVRDYKLTDYRPRISIKDEKGRTKDLPEGRGKARYELPVGAIISVQEGDYIYAGDVIARIPRETLKAKDITGGLPKVTDLFEARKPKEYAIITEIDGKVVFEKEVRGKKKIVVQPEVGESQEYYISKGKHIVVREGDIVKAGDPLIEGSPNPHDILRVKGVKGVARFLVEEIQEVYRLQGVKINDKHFEVIVRQMLKKVKIKEAGDTDFMIGEIVDKVKFEEENEKVLAMGGKPAVAEPVILGITRAALLTDSWLSAASFQETTRVLTEASIAGKVDYLKGLKENVIIGRLIPAGTGRIVYEEKGWV